MEGGKGNLVSPVKSGHSKNEKYKPLEGGVGIMSPIEETTVESLDGDCEMHSPGRGNSNNPGRGRGPRRGRGYRNSPGRGGVNSPGRGFDINRGRGFDINRGRGFDINRGRGFDINRGRGFDKNRGRGFDKNRGRGHAGGPGRGCDRSPGRENLIGSENNLPESSGGVGVKSPGKENLVKSPRKNFKSQNPAENPARPLEAKSQSKEATGNGAESQTSCMKGSETGQKHSEEECVPSSRAEDSLESTAEEINCISETTAEVEEIQTKEEAVPSTPENITAEATEPKDHADQQTEEQQTEFTMVEKKRNRHHPPAIRYPKRSKRDKEISGTDDGEIELEFTEYVQARVEAEEHFNKKFLFKKPSDENETWNLPPVETMFTKPIWQDEELQTMKAHLNGVKQQLSDKNVATWHNHTKNTNPAEKIVSLVKRRANPEMVTQAWLKFYEIIHAYAVVPAQEELVVPDEEEQENQENTDPERLTEFNSVHLCEAPGAFIVALNHYLALNRPSFKWCWLGNTLNPYYEGSPSELCVVEDRLIYLTLHNWTFGRDNTGDLMEPENLQELKHRAESMGPIHLVTADGSVDCQSLPGEQESTTHLLHFCEAVSAMAILEPGGSLVLKKFTMFECQTVNLMYLLCCVFNEVHVFKPGSSKEGNSEVYVVCLDYCGKEVCELHLEKLSEVYGNANLENAMFSLNDLPEDFMVQLRKCCEVFKAHQVKTITKNLTLFEKVSIKDQQYINLLKSNANSYFFYLCPCSHIPKTVTLTESKVNKSRYLLETDLVKPNTSLIVRTKCPQKKLDLLAKFVDIYKDEFSKRKWIIPIDVQESCYVYKLIPMELGKLEFDVIRGKPYSVIKCSKFCSPKVQEAYKALYNLWNSVANKSEFQVDESLLEHVISLYPEAAVLEGELTPHPSCELGPLKDALLQLKEGKLSSGGSLILSNVNLLSRLQYGLLLVLASAFTFVAVHTGKNMGDHAPVIILENLKSPQHGEEIMKALNKAGWNPFDEDAEPSVLQLVYFPILIEHLKLCSVFFYNLHNCIHRSQKLIKALETKSHI